MVGSAMVTTVCLAGLPTGRSTVGRLVWHPVGHPVAHPVGHTVGSTAKSRLLKNSHLRRRTSRTPTEFCVISAPIIPCATPNSGLYQGFSSFSAVFGGHKVDTNAKSLAFASKRASGVFALVRIFSGGVSAIFRFFPPFFHPRGYDGDTVLVSVSWPLLVPPEFTLGGMTRIRRGEAGNAPHNPYYIGTTSARDAQIIQLRQAGYKLRQIAAHLGMSVSGVSDACRRIAAGRPGRDPRD
jgi:DNA-binding CsgD family transcriptional regulator